MSTPKQFSQSFEEYMKMQKKNGSLNSPSSKNTPTAISHTSTEISPITNNDIFSVKTQHLLKNFDSSEQKKILKLWYDITTIFGHSKVRQEFGDEPDRHLMIFAASLDKHSYIRLMDNFNERLKKGKEWPPSLAVFKALKDSPTDREILEARTNILTLKKPITRVELYIFHRKAAKLRTLSEKYIVEEFKTLYLEAFEEVILHNQDQILDDRESSVQSLTNTIKKTKIDKLIDEMSSTDQSMSQSRVSKLLNNIHNLRHKNNIHA